MLHKDGDAETVQKLRQSLVQHYDLYKAEQARAETAEAKVAELESVTYCAYCGSQFAIDDEAATKITEHIYTCAKHPMRDVEQQRDTVQEQVRVLREALIKAKDYITHSGECMETLTLDAKECQCGAAQAYSAALATTAPSSPAGLQCTCPTIGGYDHSATCAKAPSPSSPAEDG